MTDATVDGGHIQALLLTFFFMHAPKLVETGRIYVSQAPLFKVEVPSQGRDVMEKRRLGASIAGRGRTRRDAARAEEEKVKEGSWEISRFRASRRDEPRAALGNFDEPRFAAIGSNGT